MRNNKFFNTKICPACAYCKHGYSISGGEEVFCLKKGIVSATDHCRRFKYDVLKRKPLTKTLAKNYNNEDFII